jgi:hypothetical protein
MPKIDDVWHEVYDHSESSSSMRIKYIHITMDKDKFNFFCPECTLDAQQMTELGELLITLATSLGEKKIERNIA